MDFKNFPIAVEDCRVNEHLSFEKKDPSYKKNICIKKCNTDGL